MRYWLLNNIRAYIKFHVHFIQMDKRFDLFVECPQVHGSFVAPIYDDVLTKFYHHSYIMSNT